MSFAVWSRTLIVLGSGLALLGASGCKDPSKMAFWNACTKNVKRGMALSEVERICGKGQYLGKAGIYDGYMYKHPETNQEWLLFFENDILKEAQVPRGTR